MALSEDKIYENPGKYPVQYFWTVFREVKKCADYKASTSGYAANSELVKMQKEVIKKIDRLPDILTYRIGKKSMTIGMYAAKYGLEKIALRALDNEVAASQQDNIGFNIGMYAAKSHEINIVRKALQDPWACRKVSNSNKTIMSIIKEEGLDIDEQKRKKPMVENKKVDMEKTISDIYDEIFGR